MNFAGIYLTVNFVWKRTEKPAESSFNSNIRMMESICVIKSWVKIFFMKTHLFIAIITCNLNVIKRVIKFPHFSWQLCSNIMLSHKIKINPGIIVGFSFIMFGKCLLLVTRYWEIFWNKMFFLYRNWYEIIPRKLHKLLFRTMTFHKHLILFCDFVIKRPYHFFDIL